MACIYHRRLLRLRLEGGSCQSDSDGIGPALTACDWRVDSGDTAIEFEPATRKHHATGTGASCGIGDHAANIGKRMESGVFQMILPPGVEVSAPPLTRKQAFTSGRRPPAKRSLSRSSCKSNPLRHKRALASQLRQPAGLLRNVLGRPPRPPLCQPAYGRSPAGGVNTEKRRIRESSPPRHQGTPREEIRDKR